MRTYGKCAAEQTVKNINGAGGVLGRPVELATADTEGSVPVTTGGCALLIDTDVIGLVGGLVSDVSLALTPKTADDAIMGTSPMSMNPRFSDAGQADSQKFFSRTVPSDSLQTTTMAKILDVPQYADTDRVALLTIDGAFSSDLGTVLGNRLDAEVVTEVSHDPSAEAFGDVIDEMSTGSSDAVSFVSVPEWERGVLDAYGASNREAPRIFSAGLFDGGIPSYYEGFYSTSLSSVRTDGYFHLTQRLSDITPLQPYAANAYDALFLVATTAEYAGEMSDSAIVDALQTVPGGTGRVVSIGEFDRVRTFIDAGRELNYQDTLNKVDLMETLESSSPYLVERVYSGSIEQVELLQCQFFESGGGR